MRFINKSAAPQALKIWIRDNPNDCTYKNLPTAVKDEIRRYLLIEQGYLDAYTMQRIELDTCHIEHFAPQSHFGEKSVDYDNMLACWPKDRPPGTFEAGDEFGAVRKEDSTETICSPLVAAEVTNAFEYKSNGEIAGRTPLAVKTIDVLNLNAHRLRSLRKSAILSALGLQASRKLSQQQLRNKKSSSLTIAAAQKRLKQVGLPDANGKLTPFCATVEFWLKKFIGLRTNLSNQRKKKPG